MENKKTVSKQKSIFTAYYKAARPAFHYKWCYVLLTVIGLLLIAADLMFAQITRELFDTAPNIPYDMAIRIILSLTVIIISQYVFGFAETYVFSYLNESVIYAMRRDILGKIQRLKMEFYDSNHTSKITNTFFNQIEIVKDFVVADIHNLIKLPLTFILVGAYLFTVHPCLGITAVLASVLQPLSNLAFKQSFFRAIDDIRNTDHMVFTTMGEATQGIREVKINQVEDFFDRRMKKGQEDGVRHMLRMVRYDTLRKILKEVPTKIGYIAGISIGILLMINGRINPGDLVAFITLLNKVSEPFNGITQIYSNFQKSLRSANDLLKLVDEPEENYVTGDNLELPVSSIRFDNVSFGYKVTESGDGLNSQSDACEESTHIVPILKNVSFEIAGGSTVALIGPSGSGKSTIVRLLYKFYEPTAGEITINGRPLNDYNITSIRNAMSIVSQDIFIFNGSVRDNLLLGRKDVTDEDIISALEYSESYDFVSKLSDGLDTILGERGVKLSQGQKQRLSIARSIIKKANIVILDEPTSALDVETEYNFQQGIAEWAKECTKLIIAHRLTTIRDADYILFLDNGTIMEQGSPYELIKTENSKFKEYWEKQFLFQEEEQDLKR